MVEFKVAENDYFYILRTKDSKELYVFDELDTAIKRVKDLINKDGLTIDSIEIMGMTFQKDKINAQQISWATIAEKLIKSGGG